MQVQCPHCRHVTNAHNANGQPIQCPQCGGLFAMPAAPQPPPAPQININPHVPTIRRTNTAPHINTRAGILDGVFDFNFRSFVTPACCRFSYALFVFGIFIVAMLLVAINFYVLAKQPENAWRLPLVDIFVLMVLQFWWFAVRLGLETIMIIFRIEEHLRGK